MTSILLIEDNSDVAYLYKNVLEEAGYVVTTATDGEQGLLILQKQVPDVVILDLMLPGKHGLTVLEEIKKDPTLSTVKVYIFTALSDPSIVSQAEQIGADGFLTKADFSPQELVGELERLLTS